MYWIWPITCGVVGFVIGFFSFLFSYFADRK